MFTHDHVSICSCLSGAEAEEEAVIRDAWGLHKECENEHGILYFASFLNFLRSSASTASSFIFADGT